jgi:anhydro-N-acetylmuramic acid kinase
MQIGDPNVIAETTSITTVADFRRRDMAAGGQGAPLVPAFHEAVFSSAVETRAIINIGGIANITIIDNDSPVYGFDIGPGNCLMDQWTQKHFSRSYDANGELAKQGSVSEALLSSLLDDPYFKQPHPKSTGPEYFNLDWLEHHLETVSLSNEDVLRSLNYFSAKAITQTISQHTPLSKAAYFCGGGVHNALLIAEIDALLPTTKISNTSALGIDPDYVEAVAFAWLAKQTLAKKAGNAPQVTGASKAVILGGIYFV